MMVSLRPGRFLLAGLLTGVLLNATGIALAHFFLLAEWKKAIGALNLPPISPNLMFLHLAMRFALAFALIWLTLVMTPALGSRAAAVVAAALTVWLLGYLLGFLEFAALGIYPWRLVLIGVAWGLPELLLASCVGAWLYGRA